MRGELGALGALLAFGERRQRRDPSCSLGCHGSGRAGAECARVRAPCWRSRRTFEGASPFASSPPAGASRRPSPRCVRRAPAAGGSAPTIDSSRRALWKAARWEGRQLLLLLLLLLPLLLRVDSMAAAAATRRCRRRRRRRRRGRTHRNLVEEVENEAPWLWLMRDGLRTAADVARLGGVQRRRDSVANTRWTARCAWGAATCRRQHAVGDTAERYEGLAGGRSTLQSTSTPQLARLANRAGRISVRQHCQSSSTRLCACGTHESRCHNRDRNRCADAL